MAQGEILQTGSAEELFETPAHQFVGHFIGSPGMNFVACEWNAGAARIGNAAIRSASTSQPGSFQSLSLGIRPEHLQLRETAGANCVPARVVAIRDEGTRAIAMIEIAGQALNARLAEVPRVPANAAVFAHFPAERCALYADGRRVA
jgi:glycerol transport system ATP-binding protein